MKTSLLITHSPGRDIYWHIPNVTIVGKSRQPQSPPSQPKHAPIAGKLTCCSPSFPNSAAAANCNDKIIPTSRGLTAKHTASRKHFLDSSKPTLLTTHERCFSVGQAPCLSRQDNTSRPALRPALSLALSTTEIAVGNESSIMGIT